MVGDVLSWQDGRVTFKAKNKIIPGQTVEFVRPGVQPYVITVPDDIWDDEGNKVEAANHPTHVFSLPCEEPMAAATPMRAPKLAPKKPIRQFRKEDLLKNKQ